MKKQNLIHIRYSHSEAVDTKKNMLLTEKSILKIIQTLKDYNKLRRKEFKIKENSKKSLREIKNNIDKIKLSLPDLKRPEILKKTLEDIIPKEVIKEKQDNIKTIKEKKYDFKLEKELEEIQRRLRSIA